MLRGFSLWVRDECGQIANGVTLNFAPRFPPCSKRHRGSVNPRSDLLQCNMSILYVNWSNFSSVNGRWARVRTIVQGRCRQAAVGNRTRRDLLIASPAPVDTTTVPSYGGGPNIRSCKLGHCFALNKKYFKAAPWGHRVPDAAEGAQVQPVAWLCLRTPSC